MFPDINNRGGHICPYPCEIGLRFLWFEIPMLLRCCLKHICIIILESLCYIYYVCVHVQTWSIYVVFMWYILHFHYDQHSKFTSAVGRCQGFCRGISMFFSICLGNQNAEAIKFLEILKRYTSKNKIYFCLQKKRNVPLNKKLNFVFHTIFKLDFIMQIIYCVIHKCL